MKWFSGYWPHLTCIGFSAVLFSMLALLVLHGGVHAIDTAILKSIGEWAAGHDSVVMRDITSLGGTTIVTFLTLAMALGLLCLGQRGCAIFFVLSVSTSSALCTTLKHLFNVSRPDVFPHGMEATSASFPSGHTLTGTVVYLTIAFLVSQLVTGRLMKVFCFVMAMIISAMIGFSRLYLGVHWPSDVLAGWVLAVGWCSLCWMIWAMAQHQAQTTVRKGNGALARSEAL